MAAGWGWGGYLMGDGVPPLNMGPDTATETPLQRALWVPRRLQW